MNDKKIAAYYEQARKAYDKEQYDESIHYYQKILQTDPHDSDLLHELGVVYMDKGDLKNALRYLQKALDLSIDDDNDALWNDLGSVHYQSEQNDNALRCYGRALEINSNNREALFNMGLVYLNADMYEKSLHVFTEYIEKYGPELTALMNLGEAYLCMDKRKMAAECFKKVIEQKSQQAGLYYDIGNIYARYDMPQKAIANYKKCLAIDRKYSEAWEAMGLVYQNTDTAKSLSAFEKAFALAPHRPAYRYNLAYILDLEGREEEAYRHYKTLWEQDKSFVWAGMRIAMVTYVNDNSQLGVAIKQLEETLQYHSDWADLHYLLGIFNALADKETVAVNYLATAMRMVKGDLDKMLRYVNNPFMPMDETLRLFKIAAPKNDEQI